MQADLLCEFIQLITHWNSKMNLTAHREIEDLIYKDIIDTLLIHKYIIMYIDKRVSCLDMGCGAGFGGLILGLMEPEMEVSFMDASRKKLNFVREASRLLKIKRNELIHGRAEANPPLWEGYFSLVVSRATWGPDTLCQMAEYYVQNNGTLLSMAGMYRGSNKAMSKKTNNFKLFKDQVYTILPNQYERRAIFYKKNTSST